jgi:hypothetical protein
MLLLGLSMSLLSALEVPRMSVVNGQDGLPPKFQLSLRDAFVLVMAVVTGVIAGSLLWWAGMPAAQAVLSGAGVAAAALKFYDTTIE